MSYLVVTTDERGRSASRKVETFDECLERVRTWARKYPHDNVTALNLEQYTYDSDGLTVVEWSLICDAIEEARMDRRAS